MKRILLTLSLLALFTSALLAAGSGTASATSTFYNANQALYYNGDDFASAMSEAGADEVIWILQDFETNAQMDISAAVRITSSNDGNPDGGAYPTVSAASGFSGNLFDSDADGAMLDGFIIVGDSKAGVGITVQHKLIVSNMSIYNFAKGIYVDYHTTSQCVYYSITFATNVISFVLRKDTSDDYHLVKNCTFLVGSGEEGVKPNGSENLPFLFDSCTFNGLDADGIGVSSTSSLASNAIISNCTFSNFGGSGYCIRVKGSRWTIVNNTFTKNSPTAVVVHWNNGDPDPSSVYTVIEGNVFINNAAGRMIQLGDAGIGVAEMHTRVVSNVFVSNYTGPREIVFAAGYSSLGYNNYVIGNTFMSNRSDTFSRAIIRMDKGQNTVSGNRIEDNGNFIALTAAEGNNTITSNVVRFMTNDVFVLSAGSNRIAHNSFISNGNVNENKNLMRIIGDNNVITANYFAYNGTYETGGSEIGMLCITNDNHLVASNTFFSNVMNTKLIMNYGKHSTFLSNTFYGNEDRALAFAPECGGTNTVRSNLFYGATNHCALYVNYASNLIEGNVFIGAVSPAYALIVSAPFNVVTGNTFFDNDQIQVFVEAGGSNTLFAYNDIRENGNVFLQQDGASEGSMFISNTFVSNTKTSATVYTLTVNGGVGAGDGIIKGNVFLDNVIGALEIDATATGYSIVGNVFSKNWMGDINMSQVKIDAASTRVASNVFTNHYYDDGDNNANPRGLTLAAASATVEYNTFSGEWSDSILTPGDVTGHTVRYNTFYDVMTAFRISTSPNSAGIAAVYDNNFLHVPLTNVNYILQSVEEATATHIDYRTNFYILESGRKFNTEGNNASMRMGNSDTLESEISEWHLSLVGTNGDYDRPTPPQDFAAVKNGTTNSQVDISWSAPADTGGGIDVYRIFRRTLGVSDPVPVKYLTNGDMIAEVSGATTTYFDYPGTSNDYSYYITAVDANGNESFYGTTSGGSNIIEVEAVDTSLVVVSAEAVSNNTFILVRFNMNMAGSENATNENNYTVKTGAVPGGAIVGSGTPDAVYLYEVSTGYYPVVLLDISGIGATLDATGASQYTVDVDNVTNAGGVMLTTANDKGKADFYSCDITGPTVTFDTLPSLSGHEATISFSETVSSTSATSAGNYGITPDIGAPSVVFNGTDSVTLTFTGRDKTGATNYTLTVAGVEDPAGNTNTLATSSSFRFPDETAPIPTNVVAISGTEYDVFFNDNVEEGSAETTGNYTVSGVTVTGADRDVASSASNSVRITFSLNPEPSGLTNVTLSIASVADTNGNAIAGMETIQFTAVDECLPNVTNIAFVNLTNILVYFNDALDTTAGANGARNTANYTLHLTSGGTAFAPANVAMLSGDAGVSLTFSSALSNETNYTLAITNVNDDAATPNTIAGYEDTFDTTDVVAPEVLALYFVDNETLNVVFSEALAASATSATYYSVTGGIGAATSVAFGDVAKTNVLLTMSAMSLDEVAYTITITNVADASPSANVMADTNIAFYSHDTNAPVVVASNSFERTTIDVYFSEVVDEATATNVTSYSIERQGLPVFAPQSVALTNGTNAVLTLSVANELSENVSYTISVSNVQDDSVQFAANTMTSVSFKLTPNYDTPPTIANLVVTNIDAIARTIRVSYTVEDVQDDDIIISFAYAKSNETGYGEWTSVSATDILAYPSQDAFDTTALSNRTYTNLWSLPALEANEDYVLRAFVTAANTESTNTNEAVVAQLNRLFFANTSGALEAVETLNSPYRGQSEGVVLANLPTTTRSIKVYTIAGAFVTDITFDDDGTGTARWPSPLVNADGSTIAPGVYLIQITTDTASVIRRVVVGVQ